MPGLPSAAHVDPEITKAQAGECKRPHQTPDADMTPADVLAGFRDEAKPPCTHTQRLPLLAPEVDIKNCGFRYDNNLRQPGWDWRCDGQQRGDGDKPDRQEQETIVKQRTEAAPDSSGFCCCAQKLAWAEEMCAVLPQNSS